MGGNGGRGRIKKLPGWLEQRLDWEPLVWKTGAYAPDALANYETTETIWKNKPVPWSCCKRSSHNELNLSCSPWQLCPKRRKDSKFWFRIIWEQRKKNKSESKWRNLRQGTKIEAAEKNGGSHLRHLFKNQFALKARFFHFLNFFISWSNIFRFFFKNLSKRHFVWLRNLGRNAASCFLCWLHFCVSQNSQALPQNFGV